MHYTIYKITNRVNGKVYIGKHQTNNINDGYMGSGRLIQQAITKYGIDNFEKEILFDFSVEDEMNTKEAELVTEEFCKRKDTYNLCPGGHGGFGYIRINNLGVSPFTKDRKLHRTATLKGRETQRILEKTDPDWVEKRRSNLSKAAMGNKSWTGKTHTEETKDKMRKTKNQGSKNSQFGTMWITNGTDNKKIKKDADIPEGCYKGRKNNI